MKTESQFFYSLRASAVALFVCLSEVWLTPFSKITLRYIIWRRVFKWKSWGTKRNRRPSTGQMVLLANLRISRAQPLAVRVEQTTPVINGRLLLPKPPRSRSLIINA